MELQTKSECTQHRELYTAYTECRVLFTTQYIDTLFVHRVVVLFTHYSVSQLFATEMRYIANNEAKESFFSRKLVI